MFQIGDDDLVLNDPPIVHVQLEEEKESSTVTHAPAVQPVARPVVRKICMIHLLFRLCISPHQLIG